MALATESTTQPERPVALWRAHPDAAQLVRIVALLVPVASSIALGIAVTRVFERPDGAWAGAGWLAMVLAVSVVSLVCLERLARRLLPLAALLELALAFPDRTPSRFGVALRAGMMRRPSDRVERLAGLPRDDAIKAVLSIVAALGTHDRRTRGHSERVRAYAEVIAGELSLSPDDRERLRWCSLLHDVGKLAVHPDVLQKAGTLDEREWEQIRRHPEEGARIVAAFVPWLGAWSTVVAEHHERWDGGGYPAGLAGAEISLGARIVAVADSFEVMTAGRTYSAAMTSHAARAELLRCAGSQFDPAIVRAFLNAGLPPIGWTARALAWLGALAATAGSPRRDTVGRLAQGGLVAAIVAIIAAGVAPVQSPATTEATDIATEVKGVTIEREPSLVDAAAAPATPAAAVAPPAVVAPLPPAPAPVAAPLAIEPTIGTPLTVDGPAAPGVLTDPPDPPVAPTTAPTTPPAPPTAPPPSEPPPASPDPVSEPPAATPDPTTTPVFARNDSVVADGRGPTRITPLDNDGADGITIDPTTFEVVDGADHTNGQPGGSKGTVSGDGVILYVPAPKFTGTDSITYRVCTTTGVCQTATVTITVP